MGAREAEFGFPKKGLRREHRLTAGSCGPVALLLLGFQPVYSGKLKAGSRDRCVLLLHEVCACSRVFFGRFKRKETFSGLGTSRAGGERGSLGVGGAGKRGIFKSQNKYRVTK